MEPTVIAAIITALVTLVVLLVTQANNLRLARRQGEQDRLAQLRSTRRETYAAFLHQINASVGGTQQDITEAHIGGNPSPADMLDPWEISNVLPVALREALQEVQLIGEAHTAAAAAELESMTRTFVWEWSPEVAERIPRGVKAFTEAARFDLGVTKDRRKSVAADTTQRAIVDTDAVKTAVERFPDDTGAALDALREYLIEYQPGARVPSWVDEEYVSAVSTRMQRRARIADVKESPL